LGVNGSAISNLAEPLGEIQKSADSLCRAIARHAEITLGVELCPKLGMSWFEQQNKQHNFSVLVKRPFLSGALSTASRTYGIPVASSASASPF